VNIWNKYIIILFLVIVLSVLYAVASLNFGLSTYMLNGMPIVVEQDIAEMSYGLIHAGGFSAGPFICIDSTDRPEIWHLVLRHEYQHYMQTAVLTPVGCGIAYSFEQLVHGYENNWFEIEAYNAQFDDFVLDIFYWNSKEVLHVEWEW